MLTTTALWCQPDKLSSFALAAGHSLLNCSRCDIRLRCQLLIKNSSCPRWFGPIRRRRVFCNLGRLRVLMLSDGLYREGSLYFIVGPVPVVIHLVLLLLWLLHRLLQSCRATMLDQSLHIIINVLVPIRLLQCCGLLARMDRFTLRPLYLSTLSRDEAIFDDLGNVLFLTQFVRLLLS